jgi:hypothetical protein
LRLRVESTEKELELMRSVIDNSKSALIVSSAISKDIVNLTGDMLAESTKPLVEYQSNENQIEDSLKSQLNSLILQLRKEIAAKHCIHSQLENTRRQLNAANNEIMLQKSVISKLEAQCNEQANEILRLKTDYVELNSEASILRLKLSTEDKLRNNTIFSQHELTSTPENLLFIEKKSNYDNNLFGFKKTDTFNHVDNSRRSGNSPLIGGKHDETHTELMEPPDGIRPKSKKKLKTRPSSVNTIRSLSSNDSKDLLGQLQDSDQESNSNESTDKVKKKLPWR